jgi:hypothetical protein
VAYEECEIVNQKNRLLRMVVELLSRDSMLCTGMSGKDVDDLLELRYAIKKNLGLLK